MNCPSRTEEPEGNGFNQNPSALSADLTTREDLNGMANTRVLRRIASSEVECVVERVGDDNIDAEGKTKVPSKVVLPSKVNVRHVGNGSGMSSTFDILEAGNEAREGSGGGKGLNVSAQYFTKLGNVLMTFGKFVGPGFMVRTAANPQGDIF